MEYQVLSLGGKLNKLEDRHVVLPDFLDGWFLGCIFDGHCGRYVAEYCQDHFPHRLKDALSANPDWPAALRRVFLDFDQELEEEVPFSGSTALTFFVKNKRLVIAWLGDSQLIICDATGEIVFTTKLHNVDDPNEARRIERNEGEIIGNAVFINTDSGNINYLVPTRVFGDVRFKLYGVIAEPDVVERELEPGQIIIAVTDGFYERIDKEKLRDAFSGNPGMEILTERLKQMCFAPNDDTTAIIIRP